jgi:tRNA threonylcarbamoyl adenosine modification protein YeaZ
MGVSCVVAAMGGASILPAMRPSRPGALLALDTGSPTVSVAVGAPGERVAERSIEIRRSSEHLLALVDECLAEAGIRMAELAGVVVLRGPGSFTGLRVGLATVLGFHQALDLPAAAVPTLEVLAFHGARALSPEGGRVAAAVDALRGEWFVQLFDAAPESAPEARGEAAILRPGELAALSPDAVVGFGVGRLTDDPAWSAPAAAPPRLVEASSLASDALRLAALRPPAWNPAGLVHPLYLRPPAVSLPDRAVGQTGR